MRKKQIKRILSAAGRGFLPAAFCAALLTVMLSGGSVTAGAQAVIPGEPAVTAAGLSDLPPVGEKLIPLGRTTGIKLFSKGTMVVDFSKLECSGTCPAKAGGLRVGDVLLTLNGQDITGNESLTALLGQLTDEKAVFTLLRDEQEQTVEVKAAFDPQLERWRIGAWIRDSVAGIGTITFVDPQTGVFGALGHGICDADTGELVTFGSGSVMPSSVAKVEKSKSGTPGQLCGQFDLTRDQGWLADNRATGIYGMLTRRELFDGAEALEVAPAETVSVGDATILSNVSGEETQEYDVRIVKVYNGDGGRDLLLEVTDPELLAVTGGIVQGMSGSPIIQDGKIIGAVTHVLVNDPTRGYGIFIENMLDAAG
ncbi:MAG: SpoIVB peptidase [Clostridia bacterium]|nr:SpoIVB peptidase [Clostridia bacterium]